MKILILILPIIFVNIGFSQQAFIVKDSLVNYGINIIEGNDFDNARVCRQELDNQIIEFYPEDITEYNTKNGRHYFSRELTIKNLKQKLFLEKLIDGKTDLYYLKLNRGKVFYIQNECNVLTEIPKIDKLTGTTVYQDLLDQFCKDKNAVKNVKYRKKSLELLIERQNSGIIKPFPFIKYGICLGGTGIKYNIESQFETLIEFQTKLDGNFFFGFFADFPLFLTSFSFHPELYYTKNAFSEITVNYNIETDYLFKYSSLNVPLMFRYTIPSNHFRPFLEVGLSYTRVLNYNQSIYKFSTSGDIVNIYDQSYKTIMVPNQYSLSSGIGIEYHLSIKYFIFLETRYIKQLNINTNNYAHKIEYQLNAGFNF